MTLYLMKVRRPIMPNWSTTMFAGMFVTSPGGHSLDSCMDRLYCAMFSIHFESEKLQITLFLFLFFNCLLNLVGPQGVVH